MIKGPSSLRTRLRMVSFAGLIFIFSSFPAETRVSPEDSPREYQKAVKAAIQRWQEGNFEAAFFLLGQAEELTKKIEDWPQETYVLMDRGRLAWAIGLVEDSKELYSRALKTASRLNLIKESEECRLALRIIELYNQGKFDRFKGDLDSSLLHLTEAVEVARKMKSREHELKCLRQLSLSQWARQAGEAFLSSNREAFAIAQQLKDRKEMVKCLSNIGMYFFWRKDYAPALDFYSQALELAREIRSQEDESLCLNNISLILMHLGFYEKSAEFLQASFDLYPQSGNIYFLCQTLNNLGEAFRNKGLLRSNPPDLLTALDYFIQALRKLSEGGAKKTEPRVLNNIGKTYLDLGKYHTAKHYLEAALNMSSINQDEVARMRILVNLGNSSLEGGDSGVARKYFEDALALAKRTGSISLTWEIFFNLGQCSEKEGDFEGALACYENSLEAIDQTRVQITADDLKAGFMRNKFRVYESMADLLFKLYEKEPSLGRAQELYNLVERAKARSFLETLGEVQAGPRQPLIASLPGEKNRNVSPSSALGPGNSESSPQKVFSAPFPLEKVQAALLDEKTAILEYFLGKTRSLLFVITKSGLSLFVLPSREEIRSSLTAFLVFLSRPPRADWDWQKAARRLSSDLLGSVWEILPPSISRLIIVPDDILYHLPFETLKLSSAEDGFLIQKYAVSYAPSSSSLVLLKERKPKKAYPRALLAFGNPLYLSPSASRKSRLTVAGIAKEMVEEQGFELTPLEESQREIRAIQSLFPKEKRDIYLGENAREDAFKKSPLEEYEILHFACHAYVDEKVPFRSGLFLSLNQGGEEDGFLQASEIAAHRLSAELVVLSACRTSRGYLEKGEGIMGLTRVFFYSGARSVVSTLWKISDRAAAEFMNHFYDHLSRGEDKTEALRSAKLHLLKSRYSHPFFWATFVLHGEASAVLNFR